MSGAGSCLQPHVPFRRSQPIDAEGGAVRTGQPVVPGSPQAEPRSGEASRSEATAKTNVSLGQVRVKLPTAGDVMFVGRFGERDVIGHYWGPLGKPPDQVPIVQLCRCPAGWVIENGLGACETLFGAVMVGANPPVRSGRWSILGRIDPGPVRLPLFLSGGPLKGAPDGKWWLSDGRKDKLLGNIVPTRYRHLEWGCVWPVDLIEERIETGVNPFGYEAIVKWGAS